MTQCTPSPQDDMVEVGLQLEEQALAISRSLSSRKSSSQSDPSPWASHSASLAQYWTQNVGSSAKPAQIEPRLHS
jgi:hypothetical protein